MAETPRNLGDVTPPPAPAGTPGSPGAAVADPAVRVVEQDETGALIEVTCACGRTTHVQCDYAPGPGA